MTAPTIPIFQLKVTLRYTKPPIWRRLLVRSDITLDELHAILQAAMGWNGGHLHLFTIGERAFAASFYEGQLDELEAEDSSTVLLSDFVPFERPPGSKALAVIEYEYDFGDGWVHRLEFEDVLTPAPGQKTPVCIKGARACPPEDCGGPYFYPEVLEALKNPEHPEHETYAGWIGVDFDPEAFDLEEINDRIEAWVGTA